MDVDLRFEESELLESGGLPVIKSIWDRLDVGLWFSRSGMKTRGLSTWQWAFFFVIGLLRPSRRRVMILFTNRTDLGEKEIADVYLTRWNIETFFRDAKQTLGFEECHAVRNISPLTFHWYSWRKPSYGSLTMKYSTKPAVILAN